MVTEDPAPADWITMCDQLGLPAFDHATRAHSRRTREMAKTVLAKLVEEASK